MTKTTDRMRISKLLRRARHPLVLAVGGGNDSVSTLFLQKQLQATFSYAPERVSIAAMLPDCLDYHALVPTFHRLVGKITPHTTRSVQGRAMTAFPEQMLAMHKHRVPGLTVDTVYGISMREGSVGVAAALQFLLDTKIFDLVLALDVGGDFIAVDENIEVLSPMMDGYMLHALRIVRPRFLRKVPFVYGVFGLGTDGESTPTMLRAALNRVPQRVEGTFDATTLADVIAFYRQWIEPNRYSRTADFTIREIDGTGHPLPAPYRARFHVRPSPTAPVMTQYGTFTHGQDPAFFGKYYLFDDLQQVHNPYAFACDNGLDWFLAVQNTHTRINHELNGQAYMDIGTILNDPTLAGTSLFFGTPSRKFDSAAQHALADATLSAVATGVYQAALVYAEEGTAANQRYALPSAPVGTGLQLVAAAPAVLNMLLPHCRAAGSHALDVPCAMV